MHATQDKNRISNELSDLRDQVDIKDRKINVLQRKVCVTLSQGTVGNDHINAFTLGTIGQ